MEDPADGRVPRIRARSAAELEFVKSLVLEAAEVARSRAGRVTPHEKDNLSYVTDLDQDLERLIRGRLGTRFPDDALTGEEYAAGGGSGPRRWSIDPIDGTGNMVHGLPLWAISIGLIVGGEPVLGVIAVPPLGELYWGVKGGGAWLDGRRLAARDADTFHNQDNVCVGTNALRAVDPRSLPGRLRDLGSACCEQVFVAAEPPASLHLPRRAGPRRRRRRRHRPRGRLPLRHHRRRTSLRRRDGPPHPRQDADLRRRPRAASKALHAAIGAGRPSCIGPKATRHGPLGRQELRERRGVRRAGRRVRPRPRRAVRRADGRPQPADLRAGPAAAGRRADAGGIDRRRCGMPSDARWRPRTGTTRPGWRWPGSWSGMRS